MIMETKNVVVCPYCGDSWITNKDSIQDECFCFRCHGKYIPKKIYKMWNFVYNALMTVKGH